MLPIGKEWPGNLLNTFTIWLKSLKDHIMFISLNHCHDCDNDAQVEHISLPALYRLVCREMGAGCKVKVLKMSAQVPRLGFNRLKWIWDMWWKKWKLRFIFNS